MRTAQLGLRIAVAALAVFALVATPAGAGTDISIKFDELVFGKPGSVVRVTQVDVDADLVGKTCTLSVLAENQASVHLGNDLIVSTGDSQAIIVGVEDKANDGTNQTYNMVVGPTITLDMRIGPDGMSSLGFGLSFDCVLPVTTIAPTLGEQQLETTTTAPPPPPTISTTTASTVPPTVAGAVTNGGLPQTPPAQAVTGAPAYTG